MNTEVNIEVEGVEEVAEEAAEVEEIMIPSDLTAATAAMIT